MASADGVLPPLYVFRVKRKRTADPHEALIVSLKRPRIGFPTKPVAPMLYQLATTSEVPVRIAYFLISSLTGFNINFY